MNKKQLTADVVFFLGLIIFAVAFIISIVNSDINPLLIDGIMAVGLVVEFIGLCLTYKFDNKTDEVDNKTKEEKVLEQEKTNQPEEIVENVVEAEVEEPVIEEVKEKPEPTVKKSPKSTTSKKKTTKKTGTTKKKTTTTKKTTPKKKNSTKKGK